MKNNLNQNFTDNTNKKISWNNIQKEMLNTFGSDIFESWLKKIDFIEEQNNYILISVSTRFIRDWITSRYLDQILQIVKKSKKEISRIEFIIKEKKDINEIIETVENLPSTKSTVENVSFIKDSHLQYNRIDPNKRFNNFIIGNSNKLAYEAAKKNCT